MAFFTIAANAQSIGLGFLKIIMRKIKYKLLKFLLWFVSDPYKVKCKKCEKETGRAMLVYCEDCYVRKNF